MLLNKNIIIANWKMNKSFDDSEEWLKDFSKKIENVPNLPEIVLCPASILIDCIDELLLIDELEILEERGKKIEEMPEEEVEELTDDIRKIKLGAQDCSYEEKGAFTGDVSAQMITDAGCKYVILGHSERRQNHHESNENVNKKVATAFKHKLTPILCIGESLEDRNNNKYFDFLKEQIAKCIPQNTQIEDLIIAYEPIWSIGSGKIPTKEQIQEIAQFIQEEIEKNKNFSIQKLTILYGGSTNSKNTKEIMSIDKISGLLVGGSSLDAQEFFQMSLLVGNSS